MSGRVKVTGPPIFGLTGDLTRLKPRADFNPQDFSRLIDAQGARLAWARAMRCPCRPKNSQTSQPNPLCPRCRHSPGWAYYGPEAYEVPSSVGELDGLQKALVEQYGAAVIRGVLVGNSRRDDTQNRLGPWMFGAGTVTVRPENILAINDRLVDLDSEISYSEVFEVQYTAGRTPRVIDPVPRYPIVGLNRAIDSDGRVYRLGQELELSETGALSWRPGRAPAAKTRISISYLCHAHWRVMDQPHVVRRTQVRTKVKNPTTPLGTPTALPLQAQIMLEFLTEEPGR